MHALLERLKFHGLFIKMFVVMVICIIAIAVSVVWVNVQMSEQLFLKTFSITNSKVIDQIRNNFESFHYSIVTAANNAQQSGTLKTFLTEKESNQSTKTLSSYYIMTQQMKRIQSTVDAYSVGVAIVGVNGRSYSGNYNFAKPTAQELKDSILTQNALAEPRKLKYQLYLDKQGTVSGKPIIVATKVLMERTTGQDYGMLYITIDEDDFKPFYSSFTSIGNDVMLIDKEGLVISSNRKELIGQSQHDMLSYAQEIQKRPLELKKAHVMGRDQLILSEYLPAYDLYLVNMIDQKYVLGQMVNTKTIVFLCLLIVLAALIIVFLISRKITRSLTRLARQMSKVNRSHFRNYIEVSGGYEIRQLGHAYNDMLDEINDYIDKLVETQKGQRKAELAALQQQINPHFLYNTLASVKFLVQQGSKEKAVETIHALISLLQNTISNVSETITVEQELVNLKHYVLINHVRYGERIRATYFVAPDCMNCHVPKLIIQPFIENAFFHAFNVKGEGVIHVLISKTSQQLICEVMDNGDGMDMQQLAEAKSKRRKGSRQLFSGVGVANVNDRIRLLYGDDYGVTMTSELGEGTRVSITLPVIEIE
ncbi:cache domain-containing sensor histidine kinase [Paenibacillus guangzhouensis]|uniref:cache domain-containing sensor histidine kinase n=1 Tax=Paenibacillus guangzhouensis TaxID=1473112 RepID=UPI001266B411|nr:sensor histidine kinase [Paenibacillus guangzhouensis]